MSLVIDASLTLAWYFEDEATPATDAVLDLVAASGAMVPPLWRVEVANGLQSALRRKRITAPFRDEALAALAALPITLDADGDSHVWSSTLRLAEQFELTMYDATYLELAHRRNLTLATLDRALRVAAKTLALTLTGLAP